MVAGFTVIDDVSARDWQWRTPTFTMGKSFDSHAPCGPWLVTTDELGDPGHLGLRTWVNDELRQDSSTEDLIFGCAAMIEYLTTAFPLEPGTIIATGTPAGVGAGFDPPRFLADGDTVRIEIEGIGELVNPVVQGGRPSPSGSTEAARSAQPAPLRSACRAGLSARLAMTWSAKVGVSCTRKRNRRLSMTASVESSPGHGGRTAGRLVDQGHLAEGLVGADRRRQCRRAGAARPCPRPRRTSPHRWNRPRR